MNSSYAYIAACEVTSPNAPDFDEIYERIRVAHEHWFDEQLATFLLDALNRGIIDDEQHIDYTTRLWNSPT